MSGTPCDRSLEDLFAQIFVVDGGKALGTGITRFRKAHFYRSGYQGYHWTPLPMAKEAIEAKIAPLCMRLAAEEYLDLPELMVNDVLVALPDRVLSQYRQLEKELFLSLAEGATLTASNAGAKYSLCRQLANGGLYNEGVPEHVHTAKIDRIEGLVSELQRKPVLVAYQFHHDLERLQRVWPDMPAINGRTSKRDRVRYIDQWNAGELELLAAQPQSVSHGLNLQQGPGRDIIWLGLTDQLGTYTQLNARIHRQGVSSQVRVHRVLAGSTVDLAIRRMIEAKGEGQQSLLDALGSYSREYHV
jgi:SNF2 family DNA or RNA helicase